MDQKLSKYCESICVIFILNSDLCLDVGQRFKKDSNYESSLCDHPVEINLVGKHLRAIKLCFKEKSVSVVYVTPPNDGFVVYVT